MIFSKKMLTLALFLLMQFCGYSQVYTASPQRILVTCRYKDYVEVLTAKDKMEDGKTYLIHLPNFDGKVIDITEEQDGEVVKVVTIVEQKGSYIYTKRKGSKLYISFKNN